MSNNIVIDWTDMADSVLETVQKNNVILQHLNMDYADQVFKESAIGLKNKEVQITTIKDQEPAEIWTGTTSYKSYSEGQIKVVLDKVIDKSHEFNLLETTYNAGAVARAVSVLGKAHADKYEIEVIKEIYANAKLLKLPSNGLKLPADYALLEKTASDANIASEESVVLINSTAKYNMTSNTTIFSYAAGKDQKFSDGLGANTNFANGNGFVTKEFGLNFFLSDKLSENYKYKSQFAMPNPATESVATGVAAFVNVNADLEVDQVTLVFPSDVYAIIPAGTVLQITHPVKQVPYLIKTKVEITVPGTGDPETTDQILLSPSQYFGYIDGANFNTFVESPVVVFNKADSSNYACILMSNKSVAFAAKAPQVLDGNQTVSFDPFTGMALRIWKESSIDGKGIKISSDAIIAVKAILPAQLNVFNG